ncbi:MAG: hypothetical protein NUV56_04065 [Candidatus Uhrbacteria bacterium]|nr:hypothetical protein [Candidatus Uhrbacteria bacterium]
MKPFSRAAAVIGGILVIHVVAVLRDLYGTVQWFDIPMHWFGGFSMAFLGLAVWMSFVRTFHVEGKGPFGKRADMLVRLGWVMGFVAVVGIGWEWFEFLCDQIFPTLVPAYRSAQPNLGDTMADLFFDLFGGVVGYVFARHYDR